MEGTRLKILQLLQKNNNETVDGLARSIGLAPATIRRHLDILQRDRLVEFKEVRKKTGRPEYSFFLTEQGQESLPKDYDRLLSLIVEELSTLSNHDMDGLDGGQVLEKVFHRMSDRIVADHASEIEGESFESRKRILVNMLRERDFFPEAKLKDGVFELRLLNCPFRSLALQDNSVCSFDSALISSFLGVDADRQECVHDGAPNCLYVATPVQ